MNFCPVDFLTGYPCGSWCAAARMAFEVETIRLEQFFAAKYGRVREPKPLVVRCPGCGQARTWKGRRIYHNLTCRIAARQARKVAA